MKTIASLTGPAFLRACNNARHVVSDYVKKTKLLDLRKVLPEIPEDATEEQRNEILAKQGSANLSAMIDRALDEYPEDTWELVSALVLPETDKDGNVKPLDGYDVLMAATELLTTPKVRDFFIKLASSVQTLMDV